MLPRVESKKMSTVLVVLGLLIATDLDRLIEAYLTQASPHWLIELTTRY